jgi:hypothetical protein
MQNCQDSKDGNRIRRPDVKVSRSIENHMCKLFEPIKEDNSIEVIDNNKKQIRQNSTVCCPVQMSLLKDSRIPRNRIRKSFSIDEGLQID